MKAKQNKKNSTTDRIHPAKQLPVINPYAAGVDISPNGAFPKTVCRRGNPPSGSLGLSPVSWTRWSSGYEAAA